MTTNKDDIASWAGWGRKKKKRRKFVIRKKMVRGFLAKIVSAVKETIRRRL